MSYDDLIYSFQFRRGIAEYETGFRTADDFFMGMDALKRYVNVKHMCSRGDGQLSILQYDNCNRIPRLCLAN